MALKEIKLSENVDSVTIDVAVADILISSDNVNIPMVRTLGEFDVNERYNEAIVKEKVPKNTVNMNGITMVSHGNSIQIGSLQGMTIINGQVASGMKNSIINVGNAVSSSVELIVPKATKIETLSIETQAGDIRIEDLILSKLIIQTMSGAITLNDVDILFSKLKTMSGDIDAKILESIMNYRTYLKTMSGRTSQESIERFSPEMLREKRELNASTMSGDVQVIFKGKR